MVYARRFALCLALVFAVSVCGVGAGAATSDALLGHDLVINGGAEAGPGLPQAGSTTIPGWTTTGNFTAVQYGHDDYPSKLTPGPSDRGANLFSGGTSDPLSTASQTIDVSPLAATIDAGKIKYEFSAWIGGYASQHDYAQVSATFYGTGQAPRGHVVLGPVTAADRGGLTALLRRASAGTLPTGTRSIGIKITATRFDGTANDGYTDNIALTLQM